MAADAKHLEPIPLRNSVGEFYLRLIEPESSLHADALHLVLGADSPDLRREAPGVADLLAAVERGTANIDLLFGAFKDNRLITAALAVESPGRAALISVPDVPSTGLRQSAMVALLAAIQQAASERSLALLEVLTVPGAIGVSAALREAGFRFLTQLRYLRRGSGPVPHPVSVIDRGYEWTTFSPATQPHFEAALERTYVQSMDCPELTGLRSTADILAGHRAAGLFDPDLWWVASIDGDPVGIMLLSRFSSGEGLEIVYMGVAQVARGAGVADALLRRAIDTADRLGASVIALAVDVRNTPARRVYRRWGFVETGARDAWIASPPHTRV